MCQLSLLSRVNAKMSKTESGKGQLYESQLCVQAEALQKAGKARSESSQDFGQECEMGKEVVPAL